MQRSRQTIVLLSTFALVLINAPAAHASVPYCMGKRATIVGTDRANTIRLTPQQDVVVAKGGNDVIYNPLDTEVQESVSDTYPVMAPLNNDYVCAGSGNDFVKGAYRVDGGSGSDHVVRGIRVWGGSGGDWIVSEGCGPTEVHGGYGDDQIRSFAHAEAGSGPTDLDSSDVCFAKGDVIYGDDGNDLISSGDGTDRVYGGPGADLVLAGNGDDLVQGWAGNDRIYGNNGNDFLDGGSNYDYCNGNLHTNGYLKCETISESMDPSAWSVVSGMWTIPPFPSSYPGP